MFRYGFLLLVVDAASLHNSGASIDRHATVSKHDPIRKNTSSTAYETPIFLGNGHLGFGVDITGLQSMLPFNTLASWGWHNDSLPTAQNQSSPADFHGIEWDVHGRQVEFSQPNPDLPDISQWMIANPHRINLARLGLGWNSSWITEDLLGSAAYQHLDLWSGMLTSSFELCGEPVTVNAAVHPYSDTIAVCIRSSLLTNGTLSILMDYPYASGKNKFDAPFLGVWNASEKHHTTAKVGTQTATIQHDLDATTYYNILKWQEPDATLKGPDVGTHRYNLVPGGSDTLCFTSTFSPSEVDEVRRAGDIFAETSTWWQKYWQSGGFVTLSEQQELERRIILSQYLMAANTAGCEFLEQESGLVNNGWYGKFHMEMTVWHEMHYLLWGKPQYLSSMMPGLYNNFLPTSLQRAKDMGYTGARWGKMSDESGRSAPGVFNSLLIWQQPHPMFFADREYRSASVEDRPHVVDKWAEVIDATAEFMSSFAWWNVTTSRYDLGPPLYPSSENTEPKISINPTFELAYWQFGLQIAVDWKARSNQTAPAKWLDVRDHLAPLPTDMYMGTEAYVIYEGIENMWTTSNYTEDHPSMMALLGFMPWLSNSTRFEVSTFENTYNAIHETWNFTTSFGWDFPMLATAAHKLGKYEDALKFLLYPDFGFDDVGMPDGGSRVPTPYLPSSGSLLMAVAIMVSDWAEKGDPPKDWGVQFEGFPSEH